MKKTIGILIVLAIFLAGFNASAIAGYDAEVIHWWVSGGESDALQVIIDEFESRGNNWIDTPVKDSYHAKTAAISRLFSGNPPTVVQWHVGVMIKDLYEEGLLGDVNAIAQTEQWQQVLPAVIWDYIYIHDKVVVVPATLHGQNWLWANQKVLDACGLNMPGTWDEFKTALSIAREKGYIPLALGGQAWQENLLFHCVAVAIGGPDFYLNAFVDHDPKTLSSDTMVKIFKSFIELRPFTDKDSPGRGWSETAALLINEKAAFQVMGDWAKGEFIKAGLTPGKEIGCALCPGTENSYLAVSDAFAMVAVKDDSALKAQARIASIIMDPDVQKRFNLKKGSVPVRSDVSLDGFDACAKLAIQTLKTGRVLPSMNMGNPALVASAMVGVIHNFWNNPAPDPEHATRELAAAIKEARF